MKKSLWVLTAVLIGSLLMIPAEGAAVQKKKEAVQTERMTGEIKSIDIQKGTFMLSNTKLNTEKLIKADEKKLKKLKIGSRVLVVLRKGTDQAVRIKPATPKVPKAKKK